MESPSSKPFKRVGYSKVNGANPGAYNGACRACVAKKFWAAAALIGRPGGNLGGKKDGANPGRYAMFALMNLNLAYGDLSMCWNFNRAIRTADSW